MKSVFSKPHSWHLAPNLHCGDFLYPLPNTFTCMDKRYHHNPCFGAKCTEWVLEKGSSTVMLIIYRYAVNLPQLFVVGYASKSLGKETGFILEHEVTVIKKVYIFCTKIDLYCWNIDVWVLLFGKIQIQLFFVVEKIWMNTSTSHLIW